MSEIHIAIFGEKKEGDIIILKNDPCSKGMKKKPKNINKNFIMFYLPKLLPFYEKTHPGLH